ncbi:MAG: hypothetical protein ACXWT1_22430 [Methylobacter sp.]
MLPTLPGRSFPSIVVYVKARGGDWHGGDFTDRQRDWPQVASAIQSAVFDTLFATSLCNDTPDKSPRPCRMKGRTSS